MMSKKLLYLISFVLVLGLAGNTMAEDLYPPDWVGAPDSTYAIWEFEVDPGDLGYIEAEDYYGDTEEHFDVGSLCYGMAPNGEGIVACVGGAEGGVGYQFNGDGTITIVDELWGRLNNWLNEEEGRRKRLRIQITYDPASGTPIGESETADGREWIYIPDMMSTIIADEDGYLCFEYEYEDRNPAAESFVIMSTDLVIYELIIDTICYEGDEPPSGPGRGGAVPGQATNPSPTTGDDVCPKVVLSWTPGLFVGALSPKHKVFFSENFDDVNDGVGGVTQDPNRYPATGTLSLDFSKTYYWKVDEANSTTGWDEGDIWQFTTEPIAYPIADDKITATASSSKAADEGPENTINGSGLDANDLHSVETTDMWLSGSHQPGEAWIEYEFDNVYKLHEMWVWNHNSESEPFLGYGLKDVTIEYSENGTDYTTLGTTHEFARAPGEANYEHNTEVYFGVAAKYVKLTANSNWSGIFDKYGLSEVRFFYIPVRAREESPESGTRIDGIDVVLRWRAGREAAEHNVYFSTSFEDVNTGIIAPDIIDAGGECETSYGPLSLELGKTYYWRIDEVNDATTWKGDIWSFTTTGKVYYVDDDGPADFDNIQAAIADANDGDTVEIKPGTYTGDGNRDIDFLGKAITVRSIDPCNSDVVAATIIDCQGSKSEPHRGFKFVSSEETDSVLAGLTITNGYAPRDMSWDPTMVWVGGAILCDGASPTISYCTIANNWSNWSGGGIFCRDSSLTISQCAVIDNTANFYGGGIFCYRGNPTIIYSIISGNLAEQFSGGGIYCHYDTTPTIRHCVITGNSTGGHAGGVYYRGGNLTIQHCTIASNSADNYTGGGIHCWENCNLLVSHCILWGNTAPSGPQIYKDGTSSVTVSYSDVQGGWPGETNIDAAPCFVAPGYWVDVSEPNIPVEPNDPNAFWIHGDYHLQSQAGRWDPNSQTWGTDANTSPCIDAGDSNSDWTAELWPHGGCINMGAYGGTPEASMSLSDAGNIADLNIDGSVDYRDMAVFTDKWLYEAVLLAEDLNRDGFVNFTDFAIFADNWRRPPGRAGNPGPADGATGIGINADLSWTAGAGATSHDVYFGTSNPPPFIRNQTAKTFEPCTMTISTTYYWRIDEVNAWGKTTGTVWSFTTTTGPPPP